MSSSSIKSLDVGSDGGFIDEHDLQDPFDDGGVAIVLVGMAEATRIVCFGVVSFSIPVEDYVDTESLGRSVSRIEITVVIAVIIGYPANWWPPVGHPHWCHLSKCPSHGEVVKYLVLGWPKRIPWIIAPGRLN